MVCVCIIQHSALSNKSAILAYITYSLLRDINHESPYIIYYNQVMLFDNSASRRLHH